MLLASRADGSWIGEPESAGKGLRAIANEDWGKPGRDGETVVSGTPCPARSRLQRQSLLQRQRQLYGPHHFFWEWVCSWCAGAWRMATFTSSCQSPARRGKNPARKSRTRNAEPPADPDGQGNEGRHHQPACPRIGVHVAAQYSPLRLEQRVRAHAAHAQQRRSSMQQQLYIDAGHLFSMQ